MTNPTKGDKLFDKVKKTLGQMSEAKAEVRSLKRFPTQADPHFKFFTLLLLLER